MKYIEPSSKPSLWLVALFASALVTGCNDGHWDGKSPATAGDDPDDGSAVPLTVTISNPNNNATGIAVSSPISVVFNVPMNESTINDTNFTLTGPDADDVPGDVSYSSNNRTATFVPDADLEFTTDYTAAISTDVESADGARLAVEHSWTFTTYGANVAVSESNPLNENVDVCTNKAITITFDRPMNPATIESPATSFTLMETLSTDDVSGVVSLNSAGTTATFTPDPALLANIEYTATVSTDAVDLNGSSLEAEEVWSFTTDDSLCQAAITLGATEPYGVLSGIGVTLGGGPDSTTGLRVDGDVGIFPSGACVGCDGTTVSGLIEIGNTAASDAIDAMEAAYNDAINRATNQCTLIDSGVLTTNPSLACGGNADGVFAPGLYWSGTSIAIPAGGTITLDAKNDADAVFIFQSESTIDTIGGDTHMILANGAQAKNIFWVAASSATIGGVDSDFAGTILALIGITVNTGTDMEGRALAQSAEVTVQDGALITVPAE